MTVQVQNVEDASNKAERIKGASDLETGLRRIGHLLDQLLDHARYAAGCPSDSCASNQPLAERRLRYAFEGIKETVESAVELLFISNDGHAVVIDLLHRSTPSTMFVQDRSSAPAARSRRSTTSSQARPPALRRSPSSAVSGARHIVPQASGRRADFDPNQSGWRGRPAVIASPLI
jgi:hypothetical protein